MSDDPSIRNHRITKPCFRTCLTHESHSQAPLCLCTLCLIADQAECTFGLLRYSFGGDRPSQTAQLTLSAAWIHRTALERRHVQGGISPLSPSPLAWRLHRLPPILHRTRPRPISAY